MVTLDQRPSLPVQFFLSIHTSPRWTNRPRTAPSSCSQCSSYVLVMHRPAPAIARAHSPPLSIEFLKVSIATILLVPYTAYLIFGGDDSVRHHRHTSALAVAETQHDRPHAARQCAAFDQASTDHIPGVDSSVDLVAAHWRRGRQLSLLVDTTAGGSRPRTFIRSPSPPLTRRLARSTRRWSVRAKRGTRIPRNRAS